MQDRTRRKHSIAQPQVTLIPSVLDHPLRDLDGAFGHRGLRRLSIHTDRSRYNRHRGADVFSHSYSNDTGRSNTTSRVDPCRSSTSLPRVSSTVASPTADPTPAPIPAPFQLRSAMPPRAAPLPARIAIRPASWPLPGACSMVFSEPSTFWPV